MGTLNFGPNHITVNLNGFLQGQKGILWQSANYLLKKNFIFTSSQIQSKSAEMKILLFVFSNLISGFGPIQRFSHSLVVTCRLQTVVLSLGGNKDPN